MPRVVLATTALFLAATAQAVPCKRELEVRADSVVSFFSTQNVAVEKCVARRGFKGIVALKNQVY